MAIEIGGPSDLYNLLSDLGQTIDAGLNGTRSGGKRWGFTLLVHPYGNPHERMDAISNGAREDSVAAMKEVLMRWDTEPAVGPETMQ